MALEYSSVPDTYQDSVKLMRVSSDVADALDVDEAVAVMGTEANKRMLVESDLLDESALESFDPNDLILVARDDDPDLAAAALEEMEAEIRGGRGGGADDVDREEQRPRTLYTAMDRVSNPNLALVSVPGEYATREAWKALHEDLHVFLFSDNVPVDDERRLKSHGRDHDRLVMGPDCGTAILNGVPLGFANEVAAGSVGVVSAAGTGLQEVTSLVDRAGGGVSQAIGTGSRDLRDDVGGTTTKQGLAMLADDDGTEVVVLVSKPPDDATAAEVLAEVRDCPKPVVVDFVGSDPDSIAAADAIAAATLREAARLAIRELPGRTSSADVSFDDGVTGFTAPDEAGDIVDGRRPSDPDRRYVRGLYTGGTLCSEAVTLLRDRVDDIASNVGVGTTLEDPTNPAGNAFVDFGADDLTRGRPHPMIDPTVRDDQVREALANDDVLVVLVDVVLGYGAHPDPAGSLVEAIEGTDGDRPVVVASVCGTRGDPQSWAEQVRTLTEAGVHVGRSNADAAELAGNILAAATNGGGPA